MQAVSKSIISLTVNHPSFDINGSDVWSKGLFVTTRAARFCSFCNFLSVVSPAQPQTEQQYLKCESTMLKYVLCMVCSERYLLEYLSIPIPLEIFPIATLICSFQLNGRKGINLVIIRIWACQLIWACQNFCASVSGHGTPSLTSLPKYGEVNCEVRPPRSPIRSLTSLDRA